MAAPNVSVPFGAYVSTGLNGIATTLPIPSGSTITSTEANGSLLVAVIISPNINGSPGVSTLPISAQTTNATPSASIGATSQSAIAAPPIPTSSSASATSSISSSNGPASIAQTQSSNAPSSTASSSASEPSTAPVVAPKTSNTGLIAGVAVLGALLAITLGILAFLLLRKRRSKDRRGQYAPTYELKAAHNSPATSLESQINSLETQLHERDAQLRDSQAALFQRSRGAGVSGLDDKQVNERFLRLSKSINDWVISNFKAMRPGNSPVQEVLAILQRSQPNHAALLREPRTKYLVIRSLVAEVIVQAFTTEELLGIPAFSELKQAITTAASTAEANEWRAQTMTLLEKTSDYRKERKSSVEEISKKIDSMTSNLAGLGPSEARLKQLRQVVDSAANLALDLGKQRALFKIIMERPGIKTFDASSMEDALQDNKGENLQGRPIQIVVFPAVVKWEDDLRAGHDSGRTISKAQVLDAPPNRQRGGNLNGAFSKEINAATRQVHTHLNRLVLNRLPLALPPNTNDPIFYTTGLLHFANIYIAFESAWIRALERPPERISPILEQLFIPPLLRTTRLKEDLATLLNVSPHEVDDQLTNAQTFPHLSAFTAHINLTTAQKPHVIIAYAWVLYMALFNGGRWIRSQLTSARDSSWTLSTPKTTSSTPDHTPEQALSFWHFPGPHNGEDIKDHFKSQLQSLETQLSLEEREDIIDEARVVFENCALLVEELDGIIAAKQNFIVPDSAPMLLKHVLPMGMADLIIALATRVGFPVPLTFERIEQAKRE
ncbi:MAG: hypothetical protein Q9187_006945 [Circinaria calcarea]